MAKKNNEEKTNAMRILDRAGIEYSHMSYACNEFTDGVTAADALGLPHELVYKTLVTKGSDGQHYVFVIPVALEMDMKKCAASVGVKSVSMICAKDLFALTGYVRGGCTPIGMKKPFTTRIDSSAKAHPKIFVSAGRVGANIKLSPDDLLKVTHDSAYADLVQQI